MYHVVDSLTGKTVILFTPRSNHIQHLTNAYNAALIVVEATNAHFGREACYVDYRP